jgi:hypothetical protein
VTDTFSFKLPTKRITRFSETYYRVIVTGPDGQTSTFPADGSGVRMGAEPSLVALEMARNTLVSLFSMNGEPVFVFPRRTSGARCVCYDAVTSKLVRANCVTCYGTGWAGGYHKPVITCMDLGKPRDTVQLQNIGKTNVDVAAFLAPNTPRLKENDLIVDRLGRRWAVAGTISRAEVFQYSTSQAGTLFLCPETDVEYRLPVDLSLLQNTAFSKHFLTKVDL